MKISRSKDRAAFFVAAAALMLLGGCYIDPNVFEKQIAIEAGGEPERVPIYEHAGWTVARASFHNHTIYSDGAHTPEDLLELARQQGMAVLAYNDHREGKICMDGVLCVQAGGVEKVGYDAYFDHLSKIQETAEDQNMIVTRGIEVSSPYLYNAGKFPHIVIVGQFRHFTVYDIEDTKIFNEMPARRKIESLKPETDPGDEPYQKFVDYIVDHGGIVHAVHVELSDDSWLGTIHVLTPPPLRNLLLKNLTGFSILPDAWHEKTGGPGGYWDTVLLEYTFGMRDTPLWASADADYHGPEGSLATATTLLYMREFTEQEVYRCMREGRMVALAGEAFQDTYVTEWLVDDSINFGEPIMLGREVKLKRAPIVRFSLDHPVEGVRIRLVRNGTVIHEQAGSEMTYVDNELGAKKEPAYYRVEVIGPKKPGGDPYRDVTMPESLLYVNPIFVRFSND
jgi:hypothetical protein